MHQILLWLENEHDDEEDFQEGNILLVLPCQHLSLFVPTPAWVWGNQSNAAQPEFLWLHLPQVMLSFQNREPGFR